MHFKIPAGEDFVNIGRQILKIGLIMTQCYNISIISDGIVETNETFVVVLSSSDSGVILQNNMSEVTIVDSSKLQKYYAKLP